MFSSQVVVCYAKIQNIYLYIKVKLINNVECDIKKSVSPDCQAYYDL
jgi:hypothetical protein